MKDPGYTLIGAYVNALRNNVIVDGAAMNVFAFEQPNEEYGDCIIVTGVDMTDTPGGKKVFDTDNAVLIEVVTRYQSGGSMLRAENAANEILKIVCPADDEIDLGGEFQNVFSRFIASNHIVESTGTEKIYRKLIRVRNIVHEK